MLSWSRGWGRESFAPSLWNSLVLPGLPASYPHTLTIRASPVPETVFWEKLKDCHWILPFLLYCVHKRILPLQAATWNKIQRKPQSKHFILSLCYQISEALAAFQVLFYIVGFVHLPLPPTRLILSSFSFVNFMHSNNSPSKSYRTFSWKIACIMWDDGTDWWWYKSGDALHVQSTALAHHQWTRLLHPHPTSRELTPGSLPSIFLWAVTTPLHFLLSFLELHIMRPHVCLWQAAISLLISTGTHLIFCCGSLFIPVGVCISGCQSISGFSLLHLRGVGRTVYRWDLSWPFMYLAQPLWGTYNTLGLC